MIIKIDSIGYAKKTCPFIERGIKCALWRFYYKKKFLLSLLFSLRAMKRYFKRGDDYMYEILKTLDKPSMSILMMMKLYY